MVNITVFTTFALSLLSLSISVRAQSAPAPAPAASTFFLPHSSTQFSVNIANDSSDVYFFLSAPAHAWIGFGFGKEMERSLMLVAYPDASGANITVSPRMGRTGGEPITTHNVKVEVLPGSRVDNGVMSLNARCKDCRVWPNGFLDATSTVQDMIFAFGPREGLRSLRADAPLKRHVRYGHFTIDLTAATGVGAVPLRRSESRGVVMGEVREDADRKVLAHALLGCLVVFVVWPANILVGGFTRRMRFHVLSSVAVIVCVGVVYGLGISASNQYNRTKLFTTPHQLLALIFLFPIILLTLLPTTPLKLHASIPRLHTPLCNLALCCLLITGGLGLQLTQQTRALVLVYTALSLLLVAFMGVAGVLARRRGRASGGSMGVEGGARGSVAELGLLRKESSEVGSATSLKGFLAESRRDGQGGGEGAGLQGGGEEKMKEKEKGGRLFGGGTMPGPQYLLNMHPGVPVHIGSGRRI